jgi:hypothetical protein
MTDLLIYETGAGGDLKLRGNDFATVNGYENAPYMSMFGGNGYWGNYMFPNNPFNSQTEPVLQNTPLTSAGRVAIEQAMANDLKFLENIPGTTVVVNTVIKGPQRLDATININGKDFYLQWNPDQMYLKYEVK